MATSSSSIVSSLGAGSGIDIKALAENLVEAERKPLKDRIDAKVKQSEAKISGYGALSYQLGVLQKAFQNLNSSFDSGGLNLSNSQPAAFTATMSSTAVRGSYDISVSQLATDQRSRSAEFASATADLNSAQPLVLNLTTSTGTFTITVASPASPQAIKEAINADANAQAAGVKADLLSYNRAGVSRFALELTGITGANNAFTLAVDPSSYQQPQGADPNNPTSPPVLQKDFLQEAADAKFRIGNQTYAQSSNSVSGIIPGVSLSLSALTSGNATLKLSRDVQSTKDSIKSLISSYNDFQTALKELTNSKSQVETLGGSLVGDNLLRSIRNQIQRLVTGPDTAARAGEPPRTLRDLGISIDATGRMVMPSESKLNNALDENFADVVTLFKTTSSSGKEKLGDVVNVIERLISDKSYDKGLIQKQIDSVGKDVQKYKDDLTRLQERMQKSLDRYMNQFSVMESMVGNATSLRTGLKSSFEGMMAAYK